MIFLSGGSSNGSKGEARGPLNSPVNGNISPDYWIISYLLPNYKADGGRSEGKSTISVLNTAATLRGDDFSDNQKDESHGCSFCWAKIPCSLFRKKYFVRLLYERFSLTTTIQLSYDI